LVNYILDIFLFKLSYILIITKLYLIITNIKNVEKRRVKIVSKIIEIGNSLGFIIDKKNCKYLKLKKGSLVLVEIEKVDSEKKENK